jgi:hypothetical protein
MHNKRLHIANDSISMQIYEVQNCVD